ncbi:hypothetical protein ACHAXS_004099 [Conticribra weissflogii]
MGAPRLLPPRLGNSRDSGSGNKDGANATCADVGTEHTAKPSSSSLSTVPISSTFRQHRRSFFSRKYSSSSSSSSSSKPSRSLTSNSNSTSNSDSSSSAAATVASSHERNENDLNDANRANATHGDAVTAERTSSKANPKRMVHLFSIANDADSEGVQIDLDDGDDSCGRSCGDEDEDENGAETNGNGNDANEDDEEENEIVMMVRAEPPNVDGGEAAAGGEREGGKKTKFGSFLKGGKKGGDEGHSNGETGDRGAANGGGGGANSAGSGNDDDNHNNDNNDNDNNNNNDKPHPQTNFGPHRIRFAAQCTLPIHPGPESTAPKSHPSWTPVAGTEFKVRCGPNYPKNGKKENSKNSLYEVYCVRFFRSQKRTVGGATRIMPLPEADPRMMKKEGGENGNVNEDVDDDRATNFNCPELKGTRIPDVLVVHFMLPYEPPNMFKQKDDGPGGEVRIQTSPMFQKLFVSLLIGCHHVNFHFFALHTNGVTIVPTNATKCVYYLRPSQRFLDEISGRIPATPATKLFAKWCSECQSNLKMRSRFKCMALVRDLEKHNLGLLKTYNGKPVLITESGRVCSGYHGDVRYLEMTANVHFWAFMAKKGFVSIIPKFKNMQMEVGFTIEAHTDNEMPECMLGSTVLSYISDTTGPMISKEMQQPVHEHQS